MIGQQLDDAAEIDLKSVFHDGVHCQG
jgi:hypothetical protein